MNQPPFAEYPRPGNVFVRGPGVYFEAIGEAWKLVIQDLGHWVAATIVYFVLAWALSLPVSLLTQSMMPGRNPRADQVGQMFAVLGLQFVLNIIPTAVSTILYTGMIAMGVRKARGEYINVGMIFEPFRRFGSVFGASMLYYLIVLASFLACFFPVLFFSPVLFLLPTVAYLKGMGPVEALSATFDACKRYWAGLFGLLFVLSLLLFVGLLACLVGILVAWPVYCVTMAIHYRAFFESEPAPTAPLYG